MDVIFRFFGQNYTPYFTVYTPRPPCILAAEESLDPGMITYCVPSHLFSLGLSSTDSLFLPFPLWGVPAAQTEILFILTKTSIHTRVAKKKTFLYHTHLEEYLVLFITRYLLIVSGILFTLVSQQQVVVGRF